MHDMFNYKWSVIFRTILFTKEACMYIYIPFLPFYWMKIFLCHVMTLWINGALFKKICLLFMLDEMFQRSTISKGPISISGGNKLLSMKWKTNKQKTLHQLSYSKSVTNYEAFCWNISSNINSFFLKSGRE